MALFTQNSTGVSVTVRVTPRAGKTAIAGVREDVLFVKLAAAPVDGAANDALVALLADAFELPRAEHHDRGRRQEPDQARRACAEPQRQRWTRDWRRSSRINPVDAMAPHPMGPGLWLADAPSESAMTRDRDGLGRARSSPGGTLNRRVFGRLWESLPPARFVAGPGVPLTASGGFAVAGGQHIAAGRVRFSCLRGPIGANGRGRMLDVAAGASIEAVNGIMHPAVVAQTGADIPGRCDSADSDGPGTRRWRAGSVVAAMI